MNTIGSASDAAGNTSCIVGAFLIVAETGIFSLESGLGVSLAEPSRLILPELVYTSGYCPPKILTNFNGWQETVLSFDLNRQLVATADGTVRKVDLIEVEDVNSFSNPCQVLIDGVDSGVRIGYGICGPYLIDAEKIDFVQRPEPDGVAEPFNPDLPVIESDVLQSPAKPTTPPTDESATLVATRLINAVTQQERIAPTRHFFASENSILDFSEADVIP